MPQSWQECDTSSTRQARAPTITFWPATSQSRSKTIFAIGLPLTVLRPVTIMEEIPWFWLSLLGGEAVLATPYDPDKRLPMICLDDVAGLAARAIPSPLNSRDRRSRSPAMRPAWLRWPSC